MTAGYFILDRALASYSQPANFALDTVRREEIEIVKPVVLYGMEINNLEVIVDNIKRNQRFTDLLADYYVSSDVQRQLSSLPRKIFDFRKIYYNKKYTLMVEHDSIRTLKALVYEPNPIDYYIFRFSDSVRVEEGHREVITEEKEVAGVIGSSLSETIDNLGISHELTNRFVDIFAWQVDFQRLQKGDRFKLFFEEQQVEGQPIGALASRGNR